MTFDETTGGHYITVPLNNVDMAKAKEMSNKIIDLFEKAGIEPGSEVIMALMMIATEHAPGASVTPMSRESALDLLRRHHEPSGSMPKDKDGKPIFMAPQPKMLQ